MPALTHFLSAKRILLPLLASLWASALPAATGIQFGEAPEPLPVEEAFVPEVTARGRDQLVVTFAVAEGYYLYRDKLSFSITDAESQVGEPVLPEPLIVQDEFFGETATYRNDVVIALPLATPNATESVALALGFQGCADMGICYPPVTRSINVVLPSTQPELARNEFAASKLIAPEAMATTGDATADMANSTAAATGSASLFAKAVPVKTGLQDIFGAGAGSATGLLPPEQAFVPSVVGQTRDQITLQWQIEPGYYLYRDKLGFALANAGDARIDSTMLDPGTIQTDDYFGDVAVYRQTARAVLTISPPVDGSEANLEIKYQGCADIGVCFPPKTLTLPVAFVDSLAAAEAETEVDTTKVDEADIRPAKSIAALASSSDNAPPPPASGGTGASKASATSAAVSTTAGTGIAPPVAISEQDLLTAKLASGSLWLNAASFFVLGLLLAFTPCVLPMIPILSSLIVGQGESMSTARAFRLSLIYVLAMALTYTIVGVLVGLSGYNIQAWFQNPWVLSVFAGLFVLLSLSMFGFYELQLPNAVQNKLTNISNRQKGGSWTGVAIMGFLSALIVGPCVTAPLVGALVYIADTGNAVIGGVALFSLSLGMGAPLLLIGASAGRLLPKAGTWMNATKQIFGIMMLAMAIYMLSRFLSAEIIMGLSAVLALISGIYLGAADSIDRDSSGWSRMGKGVGLVVSLYGVALMVGAMSGNHSFITPLRGVVSAGSGAALEEESTLTFKRVKSVQELQAVVAEASAAGRPVMLDFYADWCVSCKEMEAFTFSDPAVRNELKNAILVQADVTENNDDDQALLRHFGLFGPPAIIFYGKDGEEIRPARVVGFMKAERFSEHVAGFLNRSDA